jgi:hypothetical protein
MPFSGSIATWKFRQVPPPISRVSIRTMAVSLWPVLPMVGRLKSGLSPSFWQARSVRTPDPWQPVSTPSTSSTPFTFTLTVGMVFITRRTFA